MVFEIDPDKPNIPGIARILSGMGVLSLVTSGIFILLSFSDYAWATDTLTISGAIASFVVALILVGQAKTIELLAVVSARVRSKYAIEALTRASAGTPSTATETKGTPLRAPTKERVIHVSEEQARQQGFRLK